MNSRSRWSAAAAFALATVVADSMSSAARAGTWRIVVIEGVQPQHQLGRRGSQRTSASGSSRT